MPGAVSLPARYDPSDVSQASMGVPPAPDSTRTPPGWAGGAAGPAAFPSTRFYTPTTVPQGRGVEGPRYGNFGAWFRANILPVVDGILRTTEAVQGGSVEYVRGRYPNTGGKDNAQEPATYNPRTSSVVPNPKPLYPIPTSNKDLDGRSEVRQFGVWRQNFPSGPVVKLRPIPMPPGTDADPSFPEYDRDRLLVKASPRNKIQRSQEVLFMNRLGQIPQMAGPYFPLLTKLAPQGSYGQQTTVLPAAPGGGGSVFGG